MQIEGTILQKAITSKQQVLTVANQKHPQKEKIIVYDDSFCDVKIGERILVKGEGKSFEEARNPGNFNQR
ncbi:DNA internalization-like competence protein ComEC/Rec2, partial [gut metagenome]